MAEQEKWQWQEPGTTWKGVGLYHITLTVTDRQPVLGTLVVPDNNPTKAYVKRSALGDALVDCLLSIQFHHPEVQVLHFCLMPDHLHAVLYVRRTMPKGIGALVRGFWQAAKKLGRAWSAASFICPNGIRGNFQEEGGGNRGMQGGGNNRGNFQEEGGGIRGMQGEGNNRGNFQEEGGGNRGMQGEGNIRGNFQEEGGGVRGMQGEGSLREEKGWLEEVAGRLRGQMGDDAYYQLPVIFNEMPFIRPMGHNTQLPNTIRYIDMNPQRLATKRLMPGYFRVQKGIVIGERSYDGVGNTALLMEESFETVHVRSAMVDAAQHGEDLPLRNYMNSRVLMARKGVVMVSPFISTQEKRVMQVLLDEKRPFICLTNNGFRDYYKPTDVHFDACATGRLLILSPWPYDAGKRHISRAECVALNSMAEEICENLNGSGA